MDVQQTLYDIVQPILDFWLLISILSTLVVVQFGKVTIKYYCRDRLKPFTIKALSLLFAVTTGYTLTRLFLELPDSEERRFAMAVALLNVAIYEITLAYVTRSGWVHMEAVLRMRKVDTDADGKKVVSNDPIMFPKGEA